MGCPNCGASQLGFAVPEELRVHVPEEPAAVALCTNCLSMESADPAGVAAEPDLSRISDALPDGEAALPLALALGQLDSLALYRGNIEALLERAERAGADPLLLIDRLDAQGSIRAKADLARRRHQLEQLLN
jgi:hypothetical protein